MEGKGERKRGTVPWICVLDARCGVGCTLPPLVPINPDAIIIYRMMVMMIITCWFPKGLALQGGAQPDGGARVGAFRLRIKQNQDAKDSHQLPPPCTFPAPSQPPPSRISAELDEADVGGALAEALAADVHAVLADQAALVGADPAASRRGT